MWDMTSWGSNYYHNVFKDLTLIHKSAPSDEWVHPICIGGGYGDNGDILIENCFMYSLADKNVDYHSKPAKTGAQHNSCKTYVKDCVMNKTVTGTRSGNSTSFTNVIYVTNCLCGMIPREINDVNIRVVSWNNVEYPVEELFGEDILSVTIPYVKSDKDYGHCYDLKGYKINNTSRGIIIKNKKKYITK